MFPSIENYEYIVYNLPYEYPQIEFSTLTLIRIGYSLCVLEGEIHFPNHVKLGVYEIVDFDNGAIEVYSYEVYRGDVKLYWYDSQPHPHDPSLASTHPHHKHIPPNIKHHRIPVGELSFASPNLSFLIKEVIDNLLEK